MDFPPAGSAPEVILLAYDQVTILAAPGGPDIGVGSGTRFTVDFDPVLRQVDQPGLRGSAGGVLVLELRTPALLMEAADRFGEHARELSTRRQLLTEALAGRADEVAAGLAREEASERGAD